MVIYVALIAAIVLAGQPVGSQSMDIETIPAPAMIVDSPLLRRDI
jgi:hypothetical protein